MFASPSPQRAEFYSGRAVHGLSDKGKGSCESANELVVGGSILRKGGHAFRELRRASIFGSSKTNHH